MARITEGVVYLCMNNPGGIFISFEHSPAQGQKTVRILSNFSPLWFLDQGSFMTSHPLRLNIHAAVCDMQQIIARLYDCSAYLLCTAYNVD